MTRGGARGDGRYWVKPPGAVSAIEVGCNMSVHGGGWTQLTESVARSLDATSTKTYLYLAGNRCYVSPRTTLAWDWTWEKGQQLSGSYTYFDGSTVGSHLCDGSDEEKPAYGVGCSNGPGTTSKTLPWSSSDAASGLATVCQDIPNAFGGGGNCPGNFALCNCPGNVAIFVRIEP